jgi:hypothetical protein
MDVQTVKGLSGTLERVDDVETGDRLPLGVLSVGDRVPDDVWRTNEVVRSGSQQGRRRRWGLTLEEDLQYTSRLLVDEARDTLDSSTTSQSSDCGLGDSLDVVTKLPSTSVSSCSRRAVKEGGRRTIFL